MRGKEASSELIRFSLDQASVEVYWITPEGKFVFTNERAREKLGYTEEELKDMYVWEIDPNHGKNIREERWQKLKEEESMTFESEHETKDGEIYSVEITNHYIEFEGNKYEFAFAKDISERKEKERALKRKNRYLEHTPEFVTVIDQDGNVQYQGHGFSEATGLDLEKVMDRSGMDFIHPEDRDQIQEMFSKILENPEKEYKVELRGEIKEGWTWFEVRAVNYLDDPEINGIIITARDITERKKAEKELQESEERLSQIIQSISIPTFVIDKDHRVIHWNTACEELTNIPEEEIKGTKRQWEPFYNQERPVLADLIVDDVPREKMDKYYGEKYEKSPLIDGAYEAEDFFPDFGQEGKWIYFTAAPLKNLDGEKIGAIEALQDITERKWAEERKEFLNNLFRQDLGSKYRTIQGYLQLLKDGDIPETYREYIAKAMQTGREVGEILDLAGELREVEKTEWMAQKDTSKILEHAIKEIPDKVKGEEIEIIQDYPESLPPVEGNYSLKTLFSQILKTRIQSTSCDKIKITGKEKDGKIKLTFSDNGETLSEDVKALFSGKVYKGATAGVGGVRYYMIKEIARHNNIDIGIEDVGEDGTRFNVYLKKG